MPNGKVDFIQIVRVIGISLAIFGTLVAGITGYANTRINLKIVQANDIDQDALIDANRSQVRDNTKDIEHITEKLEDFGQQMNRQSTEFEKTQRTLNEFIWELKLRDGS